VTFNLKHPEFLRRLAVTLGALLITLIATSIPLPGVDLLKMWPDGYTAYLGRLSVGAMMLVPVITAIALAQLLLLLGPRRWSAGLGASTLPGWVPWLALALAVVQAGGIATAIEDVPRLVAMPGTLFRISCVVSLTAGTFLIWWSAGVITHHGLGSGLWLIFALPFISGLAGAAVDVASAVTIGHLAAPDLVLIIGYIAASAGSVIALVMTGPQSDRGEALVWPLLIASTTLNLLAVPVALWDGMTGQGSLNAIFLGPVRIVMLVGLIVLFVHLWNRKRTEAAVPAARSALQALTLSAIVAGAEVLQVSAPQAALSSSIVIATLVMLNMLRSPR
jgi:preprotein translocase subunit SecY